MTSSAPTDDRRPPTPVVTRERVVLGLTMSVACQLLLMTIFVLARSIGVGASEPFAYLEGWDSAWFLDVANYFYGPGSRAESPVFYPLFPALIALGSAATGGVIPPVAIAIVVNTAALATSVIALLAIAERLGLDRVSRRGTILLLISFPTFFFVGLVYGEGLFLALSLAAYLAALDRRWWLAAVLLALLATTRLTFLLVVGLVGLEFLRSRGWRPLAAVRDRQALWFLLAAVGPALYGLLLWVRRGDPLAMLSSYDNGEWAYHVFDPNFVRTFAVAVGKSALCAASPTACPDPWLNEIAPGDVGPYTAFIGYVLPMAVLVLLAIASIIAFRRGVAWIPLGGFGVAGFVFLTLNSNLVSVHRYVLPMFVVFLVFACPADAASRRARFLRWGLLCTGLICQLALAVAYGAGRFAG